MNDQFIIYKPITNIWKASFYLGFYFFHVFLVLIHKLGVITYSPCYTLTSQCPTSYLLLANPLDHDKIVEASMYFFTKVLSTSYRQR